MTGGTAEPSGVPTISLHKGSGALRGIAERYAANPVTGIGSMAVPIATSPRGSGFALNFHRLTTRGQVMGHSAQGSTRLA